MKKADNKTTLRILIGLVVVLGLLVLYAFVIRPVYTSFVVDTRNDGIVSTLNTIVQATAPPNCQQVPLNLGNSTVTLIAAECLQPQTVSLTG